MNNSEPVNPELVNSELVKNPERAMPHSDSTPDPVQVIEQKVRRAVAVNALHKIGIIVARDQQEETNKDNMLRWALRYGWLVLLCAVALLVGLLGVI